MKMKKHRISAVDPDGIGAELGIEPGDLLLQISGKPVRDVFDYRYLLNEEYVTVTIEKENGEVWELEIEKEYEEDLGVTFESGLMDDYRSCANRCVFCFIDQMPPGMRETLYFKDDDTRLSFLQGNYVTLTNMSKNDIDRIIEYRMEPINVSVHTMNPDLRCAMLRNRTAGKALEKLDTLYDAGITMNGQIVLCKGLNDGSELEYTLEQLKRYIPVMQSLSVVPVGLTRFREGLYPLEPFGREDARQVLRIIHSWQKRFFEEFGIHFVHASDEWYILAGEELPEEERYDGYLQLENGVGMLRLLEREVVEALEKRTGDDRIRKAVIATGQLAAPFLQGHVERICKKYPGVQASVVPVINNFFGPQITVSGLITGGDLIAQLKGRLEPDMVLILPCNMLRDGEEVFLDDISLADLEKELGVKTIIADSDGESLVNAILDPDTDRVRKRRQSYEQADRGDRGQA